MGNKLAHRLNPGEAIIATGEGLAFPKFVESGLTSNQVMISSDKRLLVIDVTVMLWESSGILPVAHTGLFCISFPIPQVILLAGTDGILRLWQFRAGTENAVTPLPNPHVGHINTIRVLRSLRLVVCYQDGYISLWEYLSSDQLWRYTLSFNLNIAVTSSKIIEGNNAIICGSTSFVHVYHLCNPDSTTTRLDFKARFWAHVCYISTIDALMYSNRETLIATGGDDRTLRLWNLSDVVTFANDGREVPHASFVLKHPVIAVKIRSCGDFVACCSVLEILVVRVQTAQTAFEFERVYRKRVRPRAKISDLLWLDDSGHILICFEDTSVMKLRIIDT